MAETARFIKRRGRAGKEGLVLWAGRLDQDGAQCVVMSIKAGDAWPHGVRLNFKQLLRLTTLLSKNKLILLAQVHNHPDRIPHSQGDDKNPASHRQGYISIVVPEMGTKGINLLDCYAYEYQSQLRWRELKAEEKAGRFRTLPHGVHL